ncbi:MAG: hypothetical protein GYA23_04090 [Methanomicrobiales archaeon]|nr:hypothetical protein [Methanomicrobiales archaeon]
MNKKARYAVFAVLTIAVILTLVLSFSTPLLYSLQNDPSSHSSKFHDNLEKSRYHDNLDALKKQAINSSLDIDPELQELIDIIGPVSLTLEIHDIDEARRYLEMFGERRASIKNLIVKLDMEDSEIQELEKNTALQKQILEALLETTISLDELQSMEIQYYSESTQEMRTAFRMRGNELRKRVQNLNLRYRNATENVATVGSRLGLDVSKNKESADRVDQIVQVIEQPLARDTPVPSPTPAVSPRPGVTPATDKNAGSGNGTVSPAPSQTQKPGTTTPRSPVPTPTPSPAVPGTTSIPPTIAPTVTPPAQPTPDPETEGATGQSSGPGPSPEPGTAGVTNPAQPGEEGKSLSLAVMPETGEYGRTIEYSGISLTPAGSTTPRSENNPVVLYIDGKPVSTTATDRYGFYTMQVPVEHLTAGTHSVYTRSPTSRSEARPLMISPAPSSLYLSASNPDPEGTVFFEGYLDASDGPVARAPVNVDSGQARLFTVTTDDDGYFRQKVRLSPGRHTVIARFTGEGFPISPSESDPVIIDIPLFSGLDSQTRPVWFAILLAFMGVMLVAGVSLFLRGRTRDATTAPSSRGDPAGSSRPGVAEVPDSYRQQWTRTSGDDVSDLVALYARMLREQGLRAASWGVYQQLAKRIANDLNIRQYRTLTAREISRSCGKQPYSAAFTRFVAIYERVRYGGKESVKDRDIFETAMASADEQVAAGRDEEADKK